MSNQHNWEYHPNPRLEGILQATKYLKWKNLPLEKEEEAETKNPQITE